MRLSAIAALAAALIAADAASAQQTTPAAASPPKFENVDVPAFCNAAGLADGREQAAGYAIPADKGGGLLAYVDDTRSACHQVVGKKATGQYSRPTICPLGSGRIRVDGAWVCRSQRPVGAAS